MAQFLQTSADLDKERRNDDDDDDDDDDIDEEIANALSDPAMFVAFCTHKSKRRTKRLMYFKVCMHVRSKPAQVREELRTEILTLL